MALFIKDDGGLSQSQMPKRWQGGHCMPIALACVTGCSYDEAWKACAAANAVTKPYQIVGMHSAAIPYAGKRDLSGGTILGPAFLQLMRHAGFRHTKVPDDERIDCDWFGFQTGRFVMVSQDHAFAMIGGVVHGEFDPQQDAAYRRYGIYQYWRYWN